MRLLLAALKLKQIAELPGKEPNSHGSAFDLKGLGELLPELGDGHLNCPSPPFERKHWVGALPACLQTADTHSIASERTGDFPKPVDVILALPVCASTRFLIDL